MATQLFHIDSKYSEKLAGVLTEMGGEIVQLDRKHRYSGWRTFHMSDTNTTVVYGGNNNLAIAGTKRNILATKSKLEEKLNTELIKI